MNRCSKRLTIYLTIAAIIAVGATVLRTIACITQLDYTYGYFRNDTLITVADAVIWFGVVLMLLYPLYAPKANLRASFRGSATYVSGGIVAASLIFFSVTMAGHAHSLLGGESGLDLPLSVISSALAILSAGHFFANTFFSESRNVIRAALAITTVLLLSLHAIFLFFDTSLPLNAPNKLTDQMALLFSAIFFLFEARISLGAEKWRGYCTFGLMALMLTAYAGIPSLITYLVNGATLSYSIEESLLVGAIFIFITTRLVQTILLPEDKECSTIKSLLNLASNRHEEVIRTETDFNEAYAVQMSFDAIISEADEIDAAFDAAYEQYDELPTSEAETDDLGITTESLFMQETLTPPENDGQLSLGYEIFNETVRTAPTIPNDGEEVNK